MNKAFPLVFGRCAGRACFFSDGGVGMDEAGIARLAPLDQRGIAAGAVSADSAPIGDARARYHDGILSHVSDTAARIAARPGMLLKTFVEMLIKRTRA